MTILRYFLGIAVSLLAGVIFLGVIVVAIPVWLLWAGGGLILEKLGYRRAGKQLVDPTFGPMTYDCDWYTDQDHLLKALGRFTIAVAAPRATGPSEAQRAVLHGLIERQDDIRRQVQAELYRQNQFVALQWRHDMGAIMSKEALDETCPLAKEPSDIWPMLSDGAIYIEEPGSFSISWNCAWDEEHGVNLLFMDWTLVEE